MRLRSTLFFVAAVLTACSGDSFTSSTPEGGSGAGGSTQPQGGTTAAGNTSSAGGSGSTEGGSAGSGNTTAEGGTGGTGDSTGGTGGTGDSTGGTGGTGGKGGSSTNNGGGAGTTAAGGAAGTTAAGGAAGTTAAGGAAGTTAAGGAAGTTAAGGGGQSTGGSGGAVDACLRSNSCGNGQLDDGEECDSPSCDAYCNAECRPTPFAEKRLSNELCRDGRCWMFVREQFSSRTGGTQATGACARLASNGRAWSLAWFSTADEKQQLLDVAAVFLKLSETAWIAPLWDHGNKKWTQPEAPGAVAPPGLDAPFVTDKPRALKALRGLTVATTVDSDPSSGDAYVLCRENK